MQTIIGVRFKKAGKIYYFSPGQIEIAAGDHVIVETARGIEYGLAVIGPKEVEDSEVIAPLKVIQRKATAADDQKVADNAQKEKEAFKIGEAKIAEHALPMKLVNVEYTFDVNKIVFYFTADGRIDFRDLVKDLAAVFRTRIELRQIGVRDEAKMIGGVGCCGRPLCCATFLGDFAPVSIRMAKEQNLSLNPAKISGICGRLMCCLKYESDCYAGRDCPHRKAAAPRAPEQGERVASEQGEGKVISVNPQKRVCRVLLDDGESIVAPWDELAVLEAENEEERKPPRPREGGKERRPRPKDERGRRERSEKAGGERQERALKNQGERRVMRGERKMRPRREKREQAKDE